MLLLTAKMLALANAGEWDAMSSVEAEFRACVEQLKTIVPSDNLSAEQLQYKKQMLQQILADDAQIRHLMMPEMTRLGDLLGYLRQRQNVNHAYGY
ncbi:flagellar protein FliT [Glaciimonas soli]|nr:flagellar protein FliT [Glaciimonas soli]